MKRILIPFMLLTVFCRLCPAQQPVISGDSLLLIENTFKKINKNFHFTILPGPLYNSANQLGFAVLPMVVYHLDRRDSVSPPSSTSAMLYFNFYPSWMVAIKQNLYWNQDKWRGIITFGAGDFHMKFFGTGRDTAVIRDQQYIWANEKALIISATCYRKVVGGFFAGLEYSYSNTLLTGTDSSSNEVISKCSSPTGSNVSSLFIPTFVWDNRDNVYFSSKGYYSVLNLKFSDKFFQSSHDYYVLTASVNGYHSLLPGSRKLTLAWRFFLKESWNEVPYNEMPDYGNTDEVLGYTPGKYINFVETNVQAEIRYDLWKFIAIAGFVGTGKTFSGFSVFGQSVWLHFGGFGLYVNVMPRQNLRMRFNVAFGRSDWGFYIGLGQLF